MSDSVTDPARWAALYDQTPLCDVPRHYAGMNGSPFLVEYLTEVLRRCPRGGRTLETGVGSGYGAVWLSERGLRAEGIDYSPPVVERARFVNDILGGRAAFRAGDLFDLYPGPASPPHDAARRYDVVHHQGVLEHFTVPQIRAALAQQAAVADWVVFSVPSVFYPFDPEFGDERLLPVEEWARVLAPFDVADLRYYGDPRLGGREHVLGVLRGMPATPELLSLMRPGDEPYPAGVSAVVHTRNEEKNVAECLQTLAGWADEVIVCDMESEDATVEVARRYTDNIIHHPLIPNFDRARNVSAMRARFRWVFYLDADERVPPGLGPALRALTDGRDPPFAALLVPFRHHFAGRWMRCLYPGYTAPRLLRNGRFHFNARLHSGARVDGPVLQFPADEPELALEHFSFDSLSHYLDKLNRYTEGEAADMHRDGRPFGWRDAVGHFVEDFRGYYDRGGAGRADGVHGFVYSFLSAFYRFEQHAKLYERRFRAGQLTAPEGEVPGSVEEVLEFALAAARRKPAPAADGVRVAAGGSPVVWSGPLLDPSGYGDEARQMAIALEETRADAGLVTGGGDPGAGNQADAGNDAGPVALQVVPWGEKEAPLPPAQRRRLDALRARTAAPGFVQVVHNLAPLFRRDPRAGAAVGRTMFETDRLPANWVRACNAMDAVWVPGEFNRGTFARAGVAEGKLMVVPGCLDPAPYRDARARGRDLSGLPASVQEAFRGDAFTFLSVFDWTLHKGWDVLLRAFMEEFAGEAGVRLVLKVWSSLGYGEAGIRAQAAEFVRGALGEDAARELGPGGRVGFAFGHLAPEDYVALYGASDAYVLPSRGEGWGRPYMEAMACGLPVIGTGWGGSSAFLTPETGLVVDYDLADVPEAGWREVGTYRGHRWAEPRAEHLRALMRRAFEDRAGGEALGLRARGHVAEKFSRAAVGPLAAAAAAEVRERMAPHPVMAPLSAAAQDAAGGTAPVRVRWEGAQLRWHSLAHVNRELCLGLMDLGLMDLGLLGDHGVELSVCPTEPADFGPEEDPRLPRLLGRSFAPLSGPVDVHVRHAFPPRVSPPGEGRLVLIQPWEYGYLPKEWVPQISAHADQVWCYSNYVMEVYRASGVAESKLRLLPLGADTSVFRPDAPPYVFTAEEGVAQLGGSVRGRFVFLYVGGTIHRKGADVLLEAYRRAFGPGDDVVLVVKDTGTGTVYRGQNEAARIREMVADPSFPRIVYLDGDLPAHALAGVYAAADCLVAPYRGEGFCLPALEAMACGTPAVVPAGGPTDDFVDESVGWRVAAERRPFGDGKVGPWECAGPTWMLEVDPDELALLLRAVRADPGLARRKGEAAARRVASGWTWGHSARRAAELLRELRDQAVAALSPAAAVREVPPAPAGSRLAGRPPAPAAAPPTAPMPIQWRPPSAARAGGPVPAAPPAGETTGASPEAGRQGAAPAATNAGGPRISLCMIARDEERVLGDCLASVCPFVDEVVLVDTGSKDRTEEIARSFGARVERFPWRDDFAAARNASLSYATGDWILWVDADDTLPEECGRRLRDLVLRAPNRVAGILMQVRIPPGPGEAGATVVDHVKLLRNGLGLRFEGRIHEQILEPIYRAGGQVERSDLYVVHSGYDRSPEGQARKRARDLRLLELDLEERPDHPFVLFNVGMTAFHSKEFGTARAALERCLAVSGPQESTVRKVYAMLAGCHQGQGDLAGAVARTEQGLALYPRDPELLFRAGAAYHMAGRLAEAEASYLRLLGDHETGHIDSLDVSMTGFKAHHNLALVYQDMGKWPEAEGQWRAAVGLEPSFAPSWAGLAELCLGRGRPADAEEAIARVAALDPALAEGLRRRARECPGRRDSRA